MTKEYYQLVNLCGLVKTHKENCYPNSNYPVSLFYLRSLAIEICKKLNDNEFLEGVELINRTEWI